METNEMPFTLYLEAQRFSTSHKVDMKSILRVISTCLLLAFATISTTAQEIKKGEVAIRAEVIDTKCYISGKMGTATGQEHKECALMCVKAGVPLGLLEEKTKTVYYASKLKGMAGADDMLLPFVGEKVVVTGKITEKGGAKLFLIDTVEKAK